MATWLHNAVIILACITSVAGGADALGRGDAERQNLAQPNFLILFPDQWRYDWTPMNPALAPLLPMPNLAALRANGTHFTKAFVPSPLCAPSRACLAAGREYDFAGVPDNFSNDYVRRQCTPWKTNLCLR